MSHSQRFYQGQYLFGQVVTECIENYTLQEKMRQLTFRLYHPKGNFHEISELFFF